MQNQKKSQHHVWILSGTSEGRDIAETFLNKGWSVSVSVVTPKASYSYKDLKGCYLLIGEIKGYKGVISVLENHIINEKQIDLIIDATHPFATRISTYLERASNAFDKKLFRFERSSKKSGNSIIIQDLDSLKNIEVSGKRFLLAIGSRFLPEASEILLKGGAIVFARIFPTNDSLKKAFISNLPQENIAIFESSNYKENNLPLEKTLCEYWSIDNVLCRDSGGYSQEVWSQISSSLNINLYLLKRPEYFNIQCFDNIHDLINKIDSIRFT
tara:strand:- start:2459 stop:3271 length:813 start_codon:yes stop_codon:yes gene_type:complete